MMKKVLSFFLAIVMCLLPCSFAFASEQTVAPEPVMPRYANIESIVYYFEVSGGKAHYQADVFTASASKIEVETTLEKQNSSGKWVEVETHSDYEKDRDMTYYHECSVSDSSASYRVYFDITVHYGNGKVEYASKYKYN